MKKSLLLFIAMMVAGIFAASAQDIGSVKGRVVTRSGRIPIEGARVVIHSTPERAVVTNENGNFQLDEISYGMYRVTVESLDFLPTEVNVRVDQPLRDINFITMVPAMIMPDIDEGAFDEFDFESDGGGQSMPVMLSASRDVFDNVAGYKFSPMRFRTRGYETGLQNVYMNGVHLNDALNGYSPWSLWSGLNDATRNQQAAGALAISDYGVGGVNGVTNIDARASAIRKGWSTGVVTADAQYRLRVMLTYGSGARDDGWAYAFSLSTRQFDNGAVDGVYYNAWGLYGAVEKQFNTRHRLSLTALAVPTERGAQMGSTYEVYYLTQNKLYNPNWGWQNGKMRNARVRNYIEPLAILNYNFDISDQTKLSAALSFRFGKNGYSALDWYDAPDPRPDYYRYLPSYYYASGEYDKGDELFMAWVDNTNNIQHINWDRLYNVNYDSNDLYKDPEGNTLPDGRAKYIVSDRHTDQRDLNFNVQLAHVLNDYSNFNAGASFRWNRTEYYNEVKDLLGGKYWVNVDNFAERDFAATTITETIMNDISGADNLIVGEGQKYGHDYYGNVRNAKLWGTCKFNVDQFEGFVAAEGGYATFWRDSKYQKGLFPNESYGKSEAPDFFTYVAKASLTYKLSGVHQFTLSGIAQQNAPYFTEAFVSPRTRNTLIPDLTTDKVYGGDITYNLRTPWLVLRLSGYFTKIQDQTKLISFYDDVQRTFTNFAMNGISQRHMGVELGFRIPIIDGLNVNGAISWGDYIYDNNPSFTQTRDNSSEVLVNDKVFWSGYKVESTPQFAGNIGINYRSPGYWYFGVDLGYFDNMYLSMNPLYRSLSLLEDIPVEQRPSMMAQEKFTPAFLLNANIGKSWNIQRKYRLGFSLEVKNILNTTNIKTGGFEQMRLRNRNKEEQQYTRFAPKYFYLYGVNYYLNVYFRF